MSPSARPTTVTVFAFQVGFGDCFLLRFRYPRFKRHVLVDFGSFPQPKDAPEALLRRVADDIAERCGGKLDAVVATHRHRDHVSGFATSDNGQGPGDVIAGLDPDVVVQPWTEDPAARPTAKEPTAALHGAVEAPDSPALNFVAALDEMQRVAADVLNRADAFVAAGHGAWAEQLRFYGGNNLANRSAVLNLMQMGQKPGKVARYVYFGADSGLGAVLPGVTTRVLGPPTLEQTDSIRKQRHKDAGEFWHLQARALERHASGERLFPDVESVDFAAVPPYARWLTQRLQSLKADQALEIVRSLDQALNNTSVILLFEVGQRKLLFPGDAQIENWRYALSRPGVLELLAEVDFYKVGHHGSLNATPKTLWNAFTKKSEQSTADRIRTVVSTMAGVHGDPQRSTEVPRKTLVGALNKWSHFRTTESLGADEIGPVTVDIKL